MQLNKIYNKKKFFDKKIKCKEQLINIFSSFEKNEELSLIGVECERFVIDENLYPLKFFKKSGMQRFLILLKKKIFFKFNKKYSYIFENNNIVGLLGKDGSISIEPGGQLEFSPSPHKSIAKVKIILNIFSKIIKNICKELNVKINTFSVHPIKSISVFSIVPKKRFKLLRKYICKEGKNGLDMMHRTCSFQINIDYKNEYDFINKYRILLLISPVIIFLCKNKKKYNKRIIIWENTDYQRCNIPKFVFYNNFSYLKYIDNILNIPIISLVKNNKYIKIPKMTFFNYMKNGFNKNIATEMDFLNHLNGIFWNVRAKPQIEIRNIDINDLNFNCSVVAFIEGIIYNNKCFNKIYFLFKEITPIQISNIIKMISTNNLTKKYKKYINKITYECLEMANSFLELSQNNHFLKILFDKVKNI